MCLLVVCEPHHTPKREELEHSACKNPHGFGFAIIAGDKIISERSMSAKKSIKRFLELRAQYPESYAMWHARYATHGVKNELNCHPFKVGGSDLTYLAHNGMLDITPAKDDKRSDTRIFAEEWIPSVGLKMLDNPYMLEFISEWASGNKICVLTVDPEMDYCMYLINENLGKWVDGIWWSNDGYKPYVPPATTTYKYEYTAPQTYTRAETVDSEFDREDYVMECPMCQVETDLWVEPYMCMWCGICFDCESHYTDCLCYTPGDKPSVWDTRERLKEVLW
jgi:hypothetical protein